MKKAKKQNNKISITPLMVILFIVLLFSLAVIIQSQVKFKELRELDHKLEQNPDVIVFGDSITHTIAPTDTDYRKLGEMIDDKTELSVEVISHGSYNMGVYSAFLTYLENNEKLPETIILPINLRTFSHNLLTRPIYSFEYEKHVLNEDLDKALLYRFSNLFIYTPKYTNQKEQEWLSFEVNYNFTKRGTVQDYFIWLTGEEPDFQEKMTDWFIYIYLFGLDETHILHDSLENIKRIADQNNITVLVYASPIDYETGEAYVDNFVPIVKGNTDYLEKFFAESNVHFIDMSTDLNKSHFMYEVMPDEHLNQQGREAVSDRLAKELKNEK